MACAVSAFCLGLPVRDQGVLCSSGGRAPRWAQGAACAHLASHAQVTRDDEARRERVGLHGDRVPEGRWACVGVCMRDMLAERPS